MDSCQQVCPQTLAIWKDEVIRSALVSDAMLYSMFAVSALHLAGKNPSDIEAAAAFPQYLALALPLHRRDVAGLNKVTANLVCLTGSLLRIYAFSTLCQRPIEPYTPPTQFLLQTRGSLNIFRVIWEHIPDASYSVPRHMVSRAPYVCAINHASLFTWENRQPLLHLLHRSPEHLASEPWSREIQSSYEATLSYLGAALSRSASCTQPDTGVLRPKKSHSPYAGGAVDITETLQIDPPLLRLALFPGLVPEMFIRFVVEARPRALLIMAHYFTALAAFEHVWWISTAGIREIRGILTALEARPWERGIVRNLLRALEIKNK